MAREISGFRMSVVSCKFCLKVIISLIFNQGKKGMYHSVFHKSLSYRGLFNLYLLFLNDSSYLYNIRENRTKVGKQG